MANTAAPDAPKTATRTIGAFCWNELHTRDVAKARDFYTKVVGWTAKECGPSYTEWKTKSGAVVGGLMNMHPGTPPQVPAHWNVYVNVENVDATATRAVQLGGRKITEPMDIPDVGRMCPIADPTGAVVTLFTGVGDCGKRNQQDEPGIFCWTELMTSDTSKAGAFYKQLFSWTTTEMPMQKFTYTLFWLPGANPATKTGGVGGMMQITPDMGPMPSAWLSYIAVDDVDAATDRVTSNGGKVCCPPTDIPNVGRFSVITDPTGATVALFKHNPTR